MRLVKLDKVPYDVQQHFLEPNHRQFAEAIAVAKRGIRKVVGRRRRWSSWIRPQEIYDAMRLETEISKI